MIRAILIALLLLPAAAFAQGTLSPVVPVANQGATIQFTCTANCGTSPVWTCPGCVGSINASGLYTAPATITPQQSVGGFQLHPNNHVFNTRVDSLPLRSDSATLMAGTGVNKIIYHEISFPTNYTNGSTPAVPMTFFYTPGNNGNFEVPAYPGVQIESGWLNAISGNFGQDHHLITVNTSTGVIENMYQYYPVCVSTAASVNGSNSATITCSQNPITNGFLASQPVCVGGFTGADTYFNGCVTLSAVSATGISFPLTHALASASTNGSVTKQGSANACTTAGTCNSNSGLKFNYSDYALPANGATDAAGLELTGLMLRIQEMEQAIATGGTINHALRMTLQNGFICGSSLANACAGNAGGTRHIWPATAEAFVGGGLNPYGLRYRLKAAYNCGALSSIAQILCTQLKQYGLILSDGGTGWSVISEVGPWPASIIAAMNEMETANIVGSTNMEVVDESGIEISATSGETTNNRETVTYTSSTGVATVDVALMGVAVGLTKDILYVQAGTAAQQLTASVHGGAANTVTWTVSPAITGGSLTSGGLLTPPATIAAVTSYAVTATSTDNAAIAASMTVYIFPTGSIYIRPGASAAFTDSLGHVWAPNVQGSGGQLGCCGDLSGANWGSLVDKQVYYYDMAPYGDDLFYFSVPNGAYKVTFKMGSLQTAAGINVESLEAQGIVGQTNIDVPILAGGQYKPLDLVVNGTVTTGQLELAIRQSTMPNTGAIINAIQIDRTGVGVATTLTPGTKVTSGVSLK